MLNKPNEADKVEANKANKAKANEANKAIVADEIVAVDEVVEVA